MNKTYQYSNMNFSILGTVTDQILKLRISDNSYRGYNNRNYESQHFLSSFDSTYYTLVEALQKNHIYGVNDLIEKLFIDLNKDGIFKSSINNYTNMSDSGIITTGLPVQSNKTENNKLLLLLK